MSWSEGSRRFRAENGCTSVAAWFLEMAALSVPPLLRETYRKTDLRRREVAFVRCKLWDAKLGNAEILVLESESAVFDGFLHSID